MVVDGQKMFTRPVVFFPVKATAGWHGSDITKLDTVRFATDALAFNNEFTMAFICNARFSRSLSLR
jgi:hypothetical protein